MNYKRKSLFIIALDFLAVGTYLGANIVLVAAILPLSLLAAPLPRFREALLRATFRGYLRLLTRIWLPFLRIYRIVEISGLGGIPRCSATIFVANHRSRIDGPLLLGMIPRTGTVIKSTYARLPLFSSFVRHFDFVEVNQDSLESISRARERCQSLLERDVNVLIFPEGTRACTARPGVFRDLAFRLARESGRPVVPVVVHTDEPFLARRPGSIFIGRCVRLTVRFLAPQRPLPGERPSDFAARVRQCIAGELAGLDKGTLWEER